VDAIAANETIETRFDCGNRINGFDQNPDLNHVAGFPIVAGGGEAGGDDHTGLILVDYKAVAHREPPLITVNRTLCPVVSFRPVGYPMNAANSTMERLRV
jgi:hypothetical protein